MANYNTWVGIVEDNTSDPLKLGRCKVRIFGIHSRDSSVLPTSQLPDTLIAESFDRSFALPEIGQWVMGIFLNGDEQNPVATNSLPGLVNYTTDVRLTGAAAASANTILKAQPVPTSNVTPKASGEPSSPKTTRTAGGTLVEYTNLLRKHSCDVSHEVRKAVAATKGFVKEVIEKIRAGIIAILKAFGFNPGSSALVSFLEDLRQRLKEINKFLKNVVKTIADIAESIRRIRAVIEYILSLPEQLRKLFTDCLNRLRAILAAAPFEIISGAQEGLGSGFDASTISSFVAVVQETQQVINNAVTIAAAPAQLIESTYRPSGMTTQETEDMISGSYGLFPFKVNNYFTV
jgi:hypothetical protein